MSLLVTSNDTIKSAVDIFESVSKPDQDRLLRMLKLEKARILAKKLDKQKPSKKYTEDEITEAIYATRKSRDGK
jgi:hypothetical protein